MDIFYSLWVIAWNKVQPSSRETAYTKYWATGSKKAED